MLTTCWWLFYDLVVTACSQLLHYVLMTSSRLVHDWHIACSWFRCLNLFMTCLCLAHDLIVFSYLFQNLFITFSKFVHHLFFMTCSSLHDFFMNSSWLLHYLFITCPWLTHELFTTCLLLVVVLSSLKPCSLLVRDFLARATEGTSLYGSLRPFVHFCFFCLNGQAY